MSNVIDCRRLFELKRLTADNQRKVKNDKRLAAELARLGNNPGQYLNDREYWK